MNTTPFSRRFTISVAALMLVALHGCAHAAVTYAWQRPGYKPQPPKPPSPWHSSESIFGTKPRIVLDPREAIRLPPPQDDDSVQRSMKAREAASKERAALAQMTSNLGLLPPRLVVATAQVRNFGNRFKEGARAPDAAFLHQVEVNPLINEKIQEWKSKPKSRRVFVTGARSDAEFVEQLRAEYESQGYEVFFYQDCARASGHLCEEQAVGAFFATAGQVVSINSPEARHSAYTRLEIKLIDTTTESGRQVYVLPAEPIQRLLWSTAVASSAQLAGSLVEEEEEQRR